jgi:hypothetical protein
LQLFATVLGTSSFFVNDKVSHQKQEHRASWENTFFSIFPHRSEIETKKLFVSAKEYRFWNMGTFGGGAQRREMPLNPLIDNFEDFQNFFLAVINLQ